MALKFLNESSSRFKRFLTIVIFFLIAVAVTIAGILTPMSAQDAENRTKDLNTTQQQIGKLPLWEMVVAIFQNNFLICLIMFIPFVGFFIGSYVLYNTGLVVGAIGMTNQAHVPGILVFLSLFIFPFSWLEYIAYAMGFSGNLWLSWRLIKGRGLFELKRTAKLIAISAGLLFAGAVIEAVLITLSS
jgi:Stage II sporulation protein M